MMKQLTLANKALIVVCVAIMLYSIVGCAKKIINDDDSSTVRIAVSTKGADVESAAAIDRAEIVVTARDLESPLVSSLGMIGPFLVGEIIVPVGRDRTFTLSVYDARNVMLYQGTTTMDVAAGARELTINLVPVIPLLNITPHYQSVEMNDSFYVDINVFSVTKLQSITVEMAFTPGPFTGAPLSVIEGSSLDDSGNVWYETGTNAVTVGAWLSGPIDSTKSLTNELGHAHLARVTFDSYADWGSDTALSSFDVTISSMWSTAGDSIPVSSVAVDNGRVLFYKLPVLGSQP